MRKFNRTHAYFLDCVYMWEIAEGTIRLQNCNEILTYFWTKPLSLIDRGSKARDIKWLAHMWSDLPEGYFRKQSCWKKRWKCAITPSQYVLDNFFFPFWATELPGLMCKSVRGKILFPYCEIGWTTLIPSFLSILDVGIYHGSDNQDSKWD